MTSLKSFAPWPGMLAIVLLGLTASAQNIDSQGTSSSALPQLEGSGLSQPQSASEPTPTPASPLTADAGPSSPVTVAPTAPLPPSAAPARLADAGLSSDAKVETITERYPNGNVKIERQVSQDAAGNYVNHGSYTMYDLEGKVAEVGRVPQRQAARQMDPDVRQGRRAPLLGRPRRRVLRPVHLRGRRSSTANCTALWTIKDRNGQNVVEWNFDNGVRNGKWTWWHPNGQKRLEATYRNGALERRRAGMGPRGQVAQRRHLHRRQMPGQDRGLVHAWAEALRGLLPPRARTLPEPVYDWWTSHGNRGRSSADAGQTRSTALGPPGIATATRRSRPNTTTTCRPASSPGGTRTARSRPKASTTPARKPARGSPGIPTA